MSKEAERLFLQLPHIEVHEITDNPVFANRKIDRRAGAITALSGREDTVDCLPKLHCPPIELPVTQGLACWSSEMAQKEKIGWRLTLGEFPWRSAKAHPYWLETAPASPRTNLPCHVRKTRRLRIDVKANPDAVLGYSSKLPDSAITTIHAEHKHNFAPSSGISADKSRQHASEPTKARTAKGEIDRHQQSIEEAKDKPHPAKIARVRSEIDGHRTILRRADGSYFLQAKDITDLWFEFDANRRFKGRYAAVHLDRQGNLTALSFDGKGITIERANGTTVHVSEKGHVCRITYPPDCAGQRAERRFTRTNNGQLVTYTDKNGTVWHVDEKNPWKLTNGKGSTLYGAISARTAGDFIFLNLGRSDKEPLHIDMESSSGKLHTLDSRASQCYLADLLQQNFSKVQEGMSFALYHVLGGKVIDRDHLQKQVNQAASVEARLAAAFMLAFAQVRGDDFVSRNALGKMSEDHALMRKLLDHLRSLT